MGVLNIVGVTTFSHEAGGTDPSNDVQNIFTYSDDMFYTKGTHALKFGTLVIAINRMSFPFSAGRVPPAS